MTPRHPRRGPLVIALAALLVAAAAPRALAQPSVGSAVAMNPVMTVGALEPQAPLAQVADGSFRLTPAGCGGGSSAAAASPPPSSKPAPALGAASRKPLAQGPPAHPSPAAGHSAAASAKPAPASAAAALAKPAPSPASASASSAGSAAACSGFQISNSKDFSSRTNAATFAPSAEAPVVEPFFSRLYEVATLNLTNGGLLLPMDAGATLVEVRGSLRLAAPVPGLDKPTDAQFSFRVMWTGGSPSPPNEAGLFALVTKQPPPAFDVKVAMAPGVDFTFNVKLAGFLPDAKLGKAVEVLGDWGQPAPKAGEPGPRVYVRQGAGQQLVRLMALVRNTDPAFGG